MPELTENTSNGFESTNSIEITRGQKGTYGWTIKLRWPMDGDRDQILQELSDIDYKLNDNYPTAAGEKTAAQL